MSSTDTYNISNTHTTNIQTQTINLIWFLNININNKRIFKNNNPTPLWIFLQLSHFGLVRNLSTFSHPPQNPSKGTPSRMHQQHLPHLFPHPYFLVIFWAVIRCQGGGKASSSLGILFHGSHGYVKTSSMHQRMETGPCIKIGISRNMNLLGGVVVLGESGVSQGIGLCGYRVRSFENNCCRVFDKRGRGL